MVPGGEGTGCDTGNSSQQYRTNLLLSVGLIKWCEFLGEAGEGFTWVLFKKGSQTLAGVALWIECWPVN